MRCQVMERCWFVGKRCLDVGCNAGLVSLAVATRFGTAAMLGLDIDADLIRQASVNLSRCLSTSLTVILCMKYEQPWMIHIHLCGVACIFSA